MSFGYQRAVSSCWVRSTNQAELYESSLLKVLRLLWEEPVLHWVLKTQEQKYVFVGDVTVPGLCRPLVLQEPRSQNCSTIPSWGTPIWLGSLGLPKPNSFFTKITPCKTFSYIFFFPKPSIWSRQGGVTGRDNSEAPLTVLDYGSPQNGGPIWQCTAKESAMGRNWALLWVTSEILLGSVSWMHERSAVLSALNAAVVVLCVLQSEECGLNQRSLKTKPPSPTKPSPTKPFWQNIPVRTSVS